MPSDDDILEMPPLDSELENSNHMRNFLTNYLIAAEDGHYAAMAIIAIMPDGRTDSNWAGAERRPEIVHNLIMLGLKIGGIATYGDLIRMSGGDESC